MLTAGSGDFTFALLKPDLVRKKEVGHALVTIARGGLSVLAMRMLQMTKVDAERFYAEHRAKPFFPDLAAFMLEGPVVALVLAGDRAVPRWREEMQGIRSMHVTSKLWENAVHGSDSDQAAIREVGQFFPWMLGEAYVEEGLGLTAVDAVRRACEALEAWRGHEGGLTLDEILTILRTGRRPDPKDEKYAPDPIRVAVSHREYRAALAEWIVDAITDGAHFLVMHRDVTPDGFSRRLSNLAWGNFRIGQDVGLLADAICEAADVLLKEAPVEYAMEGATVVTANRQRFGPSRGGMPAAGEVGSFDLTFGLRRVLVKGK